jgi:dephospho-CoA kinase
MPFGNRPVAEVASARPPGHRVIGLTGAPGAGKSEALQFLKSIGIPTLQTDRLGHQLLGEKPFRNRLVALFGREILGEGGVVDRGKLGAVAFKNRNSQKRLNALIHPEIRRRVYLWVKELLNRSRPPRLMVVEVPLLFEGGYYRWFDGVLCLSSRTPRRILRLAKRGWSVSEARRREKLQWPTKKREVLSDWVIRNNGSLPELHRLLREWLNSLAGKETSRHSKYFGKP